MNRYRIILESEEVLADDEFKEYVESNMLHHSPSFKVVEAINLEGIRDNKANTHQFYCTTHEIGWSVNEDGKDLGCPRCNIEIENNLLS